MKKTLRQLNIAFSSLVLMFSFSLCSFAEVKYSNELTVSPIRIFFAVAIIPAFVVMELLFEKLRNKRVEKRNKRDKE